MFIGNFTRFGGNPVSDAEFQKVIKGAIEAHDGKYKVDGYKFRSELLPSADLGVEYGDNQGQQLRSEQREVLSGASREGRLRALQARADQRLAEHIRSAPRYSLAGTAGGQGTGG